ADGAVALHDRDPVRHDPDHRHLAAAAGTSRLGYRTQTNSGASASAIAYCHRAARARHGPHSDAPTDARDAERPNLFPGGPGAAGMADRRAIGGKSARATLEPALPCRR